MQQLNTGPSLLAGKLAAAGDSPHVSPAGARGGRPPLQPREPAHPAAGLGSDNALSALVNPSAAGGSGGGGSASSGVGSPSVFNPQGAHVGRVVQVADIFKLQLAPRGADPLLAAVSESETIDAIHLRDGSGEHSGQADGTAAALAGTGEQQPDASAGGSTASGPQTDVADRLALVLKAAHGLKQLDVSILRVPACMWVQQLPKLLARFTASLEQLQLRVPSVTTADAAALSELLANPNSKLQRFELLCAHAPLAPQEAMALTEGLRSNASLVELRLGHVRAADEHTVASQAGEAAAATQRSVLRDIVVNDRVFHAAGM